MMKKLFAVLLLGASPLLLNAQKKYNDPKNMREGESVEYCVTHKKMNELNQDPAMAAQIAQAVYELSKNEDNAHEKGIVYTIPVVFHVLHNGGNENISKEQIDDAMIVLNRDYRRLNADTSSVITVFKPIVADVEIQFVLATKAPNGNCFTGVTRTQNAITSNGSNGETQLNAVVAGNDIYQGTWPPNKYMNIIVCAEIGGAAGYTFNPLGGLNMYYNSIFVLHNYVGRTGTGSESTSRTLTHEVGHWLNLSHVWGSNNDPGVGCGDDQVKDTPFTVGSTTCNLAANTCTDALSSTNDWNFNVVDNVQNYMDYSYCSRMFTLKQAIRMRAALTSSTSGRNNLFTAANLAATGATGVLTLCKADFTSNKVVICAGQSIDFTDQTFNVVSGWNWTFSGGSPANSTIQNPTITYNTPGNYAVTLLASDGLANDTETKTAFITVLPAGIPIPYHEGFEGLTSFAGSDWTIEGSGQKWTPTMTAGSSGAYSARLQNFSQTNGDLDVLTSKVFDLSTVAPGPITLSFRYAFRKKTSTNSDVMRLFVSKDCGESWDPRKTLSATTMSPIVLTSQYTPTPSEFTTVHVTNITSTYWTNDFKFKFEFTNGAGNNVYLDDINLYSGPPSETIILGLGEETSFEGLSLYPNPTENSLELTYNSLTANTAVSVIVTDITGKQIIQNSIVSATGNNLVLVGVEALSTGTYFLTISTSNESKTLSFVKK